ncbi:hypothetical protein NFI96_024947 [Prochilodus magdalenae]|nr:hypothetical protein NFI96_024947 [Prochilodus magdalenae]
MELHLTVCLMKPRVTYNEDVLSKEAGECAICLEELQQGDTIARLPCLCIYHKGCIDEWFEAVHYTAKSIGTHQGFGLILLLEVNKIKYQLLTRCQIGKLGINIISTNTNTMQSVRGIQTCSEQRCSLEADSDVKSTSLPKRLPGPPAGRSAHCTFHTSRHINSRVPN